ncbi:ATP-grasp domain-containing protein, partial [Methyloceanibacter marginalis]|uniref:ATP-grasp domain-containing protein n=1 Tax=Methyloceanibacter marginalis TaxID=1774971 RepID=UPI00244E7028
MRGRDRLGGDRRGAGGAGRHGRLRARALGRCRTRPGWRNALLRRGRERPSGRHPGHEPGPAGISGTTEYEARKIAGQIAQSLGHVGVLCVELFERGGETPHLVVNEIAPRVHNSGHWTLDACLVSQFENHVRAICGWPLGDVGRHSDAAM